MVMMVLTMEEERGRGSETKRFDLVDGLIVASFLSFFPLLMFSSDNNNKRRVCCVASASWLLIFGGVFLVVLWGCFGRQISSGEDPTSAKSMSHKARFKHKK